MADAARKLDDELHAEARFAPRAGVHARVDVSSEHNFWTGLTMNVSEGGLFVATYQYARVGTRLLLNITLPFEAEPIVTLAEVRWTRAYSGQDDVPPGLGLQFVETAPEDLARIRRFISTLREPLYYED